MIFSFEEVRILKCWFNSKHVPEYLLEDVLLRFVLFHSFLNKMQSSFTNLEGKAVSTLSNQNKLN